VPHHPVLACIAACPATSLTASVNALLPLLLQFTRATTKYWVHPGHVMRLKLALLRHLPLLVYGAADPVYRGDISSRAALLAGSSNVTSLVSSGASYAPGSIFVCS
jgi:SPX domain protein involved in polyphosphate accumulation